MSGHSKLKSRHWLNWRAARWVALAATVPALWACNARRLEKPTPAPEQIFQDSFQQSINRDIDIVFMVDNSKSMMPLQTKLTTNFPTFMNVLKGLPGGLPSVHIGVVSSDIGAGQYDIGDIPQCRHGGDQGIFQNTPRGTTCGAGMLNMGEHFISNVNGMANYTGDIADVFSCIAALGDQGCGFEHVFGSVLRALGADGNGGAPAENANFLRPNAYLAVIMITNEDDCSAPINSNFFDPTSRHVSDPSGPLASYRCNEFGHLCGGMHPPRTPAGRTDLSGTCTSAEDGKLLRVADVAQALKLLKPGQPDKVLVAAISGPPTPYAVELTPPTLADDPAMWPSIVHSCNAADGTYADPAIRVKEWVDAFGGNGVFQSICNDSFAPALQRIAEEIGKRLGTPCVAGKILNTEGTLWNGMGNQTPDCAVIDKAKTDTGTRIDTTLPQCANNSEAGATAACWTLINGGGATGCTAAEHSMKFFRPGGLPMTELNTSVACSVRVCPPAGTPNPPDGC
jgi:hypothetical protein